MTEAHADSSLKIAIGALQGQDVMQSMPQSERGDGVELLYAALENAQLSPDEKAGIAREWIEIAYGYVPPSGRFGAPGKEAIGDRLRALSGKANTDAFLDWFGGSKVVDEDGNPLVVYHGTRSDFNVFSKADGSASGAYDTAGFHFSDNYSTARLFSTTPGKGDSRVDAFYVSMKNPLRILDDRPTLSDAENAKLLGHDGIIGGQYGDMEIVAFHPEQIKSATGNNGSFSPLNPDIRFRRADGATDSEAANASIGTALRATVETNLKQASNGLAHYRSLGLQGLGRRQIMDIYAGDIPALTQYNALVQQMDADKNDSGAEADAIATKWGKLKDERQLAELMHDSTLAQIDPSQDYVDGDDAQVHAALQRRYATLSEGGREVFQSAATTYSKHYMQVRQAIRGRIERSQMTAPARARMLERMDADFFSKVKGVYFPLSRFGKYVVVTKDANGNTVNVSRAETLNEAEATRRAMLAEFPADGGFAVGKVLLDKEFNASRDAVGRGFLKDLFGVLEQEGGISAELQDAVNQLYLSSMPDLSWAKHGIHRKGTPGFSQDARRAFAQNVFHGARYLAKLKYADQLQQQLEDMQLHVDTQQGQHGYDSIQAQQVVSEMIKRHDSLMNPNSNPLSTALTSIGFVFYLGLSPASAMVNMSQTALVAYPIMAAKWGYGKAAAALLEASKQTAANKNDIRSSLIGDEIAAYDYAVTAGIIDVTQAHDLAGIAQGEDSKVLWKIRPVMRWASFLFHHAEKFNRQVTFVAAYRLARKAGTTHDIAVEQAAKATYDGHFDYSAGNRPRVMQGPTAKVLLLFRQFGQNMAYLLARQAHQAMKAETPEQRRESRKILGGLMVSHASAAGVLGLPLVSTLLAAASMMGSSDDEPWDAEAALRNLLADTFGQKPAEVIAKGFSRLTPWDISGRVGLDRLILPDVQEGLEGQRLGEAAMTAALGPVAGIGVNALRGLQSMTRGDYGLGLEQMMPTVLRNAMKSVRYASEGVVDKSGIEIVDDVSAATVLGQAAGFSSSSVRNVYEGKSAIYRHDNAVSSRRADLMRRYSKAVIAGDNAAASEMRKDVLHFNQANPDRRIKQENLVSSVRAKRRRIAQSKDGMYLSRSHAGSREAGAFANE